MLIPLRSLRRFLGKIFKQPGYALRVAGKRARAYGAYLRGSGLAPWPEAITLFLTHRCNLRCKMCGQWGESGVTKKMASNLMGEELSFDEYKRIIDGLSGFRPNITLFGGEPLLHNSCIDLIRYIKSKGMHCLMITNGSLIKLQAQALVDSGLDELNVSLDGGQKRHDSIRGLEGLFELVTGGLKEVTRLKRAKGLKYPLINLQCTITKYNYEQLEELLEVARTIGAASLTFHNLIFLSPDLLKQQKKYDKLLKCSSQEWEGFSFDPEIDPQGLYAKIRQILGRRLGFAVDFYPNLSQKGLSQYYKNPAYFPSEYPGRCLSPWIAAYIFPDGALRPCLNSTLSYGNVREEGFSQLWNGKQAVEFRRLLKKEKVFPVCVRCTELYRY